MSLRQKIEQEIHERGPLPFSRYMELCLYDPELGYYSGNAEKFGKAGDFYTSSDVHAVFGRLLARQFDEMWRALGSPPQIEVLELGPGRGLFTQDVLDWAEKKFPEFYGALRYTLDERSPALRERLKARFRERTKSGKVALLSNPSSFASTIRDTAQEQAGEDACPSIQSNIEPQRLKPSPHTEELTARLEAEPFQNAEHEPRGAEHKSDANRRVRERGGSGSEREGHGFSRAESDTRIQRALAPKVPLIVFANEFFDALPVEVLSERGSLRISTENGRFTEEWAASSPEELEFLDRYGVHPEAGHRTETALVAQQYMSAIAATIQRGFLIVIDYGYTRDEQLAGRHLGTVMAYRQHSVSANPYEAPGEQDITAHVNFTALAAAARENGMRVEKVRTQSQFLMGIGESNQFADAFEDCRVPQERAKVALQLKHLVTPTGMGETFHVMVGSKVVEREVVSSLSGLSFGGEVQR